MVLDFQPVAVRSKNSGGVEVQLYTKKLRKATAKMQELADKQKREVESSP